MSIEALKKGAMEHMRTTSMALAWVIGLVAAAVIVAKPWVTIQHTQPIVVKGYAEMGVTSDSGSLKVSVVESDSTSSRAYEAAGEALERVRQIVAADLGKSVEVLELQSQITEVYKVDGNGRRTNEVEFYRASRQIRVSTADVEGLARVGRLIYDLNGEGMRVHVAGPEFFVSSLEDVKRQLLTLATENGKQRAEILATNSGERLGSLVSARQGVIQITKKNSSQTSSYGIYDTETIEKVVKLVVTLEFEISS